MKINYDDYEMLMANATRLDATPDDIDALGDWFEEFDTCCWDGECYDIDGLYRLYPVRLRGDIVGYEFR